MIRVLLAAPDEELIARSGTLLHEAGDVEVARTAGSANTVLHLADRHQDELDVVVLHEELGPLPVLDLARDLNHRYPQLGVVLLTSDTSTDLLRSAMSAGVRAVVALPLSLTELQAAILEAFEWAQTVQTRLATAGEARRVDRMRGRLLAIAGSKGGVGTTMLAVQLALELQRQDPDRSVCLVDLDLQTGDVRAYLDLAHRRSITDLIEVASELTTGHISDATFTHPTGLRVLLPPVYGEDAEDLDGTTAARILGGIRARFDTVIVDLGAVNTEASAVAAELADEVLVVCTPDVVSLRGANRLIRLWQRLRVREAGIRCVLNRASRDREVQPSLAERVVGAPFVDTAVPDRIGDVETAINTGMPERVDGAVRASVERLAGELVAGPEPRREPVASEDEATLADRVTADTAGSLSAEFIAVILPVAVVVLTLWQFVLAGYTLVLATNAANEAAHVLALEGADDHERIEEAARSRTHGHWRRELVVAPLADDAEEVSVSIAVPILMPGMSSPWQVRTSAAAVRESSAPPRGTAGLAWEDGP